MLAWLLAAGLAFPTPGEDPPKPAEARKPANTPTAVPPKDEKKADVTPPEGPKAASPEAPKSKPRPRPKPKPEAQRPAEDLKAATALVDQNLRLQQELAARSGGLSIAPIPTPDAALAELEAGNARFRDGRRVRTLMSAQDPALRGDLSKGQSPFAVVVTCSDSRMVDNLIFDQELGRLFSIREAGNAPDLQGLASVEYAVEHLGSKVVVVLGHTSCGAIRAIWEARGTPLPGNLWSLQASLAGLVEANPRDPNTSESSHLDHLASANAIRQARAILDRSEIVRHLVNTGRLKVVPALYNLGTGTVTWLSPGTSDATKPHS